MAVERNSLDSFVLKEFVEEASNGRRSDVILISYEHFVLKILEDFAKGELPFKYLFLLQFSKVFQEAAEYARNKQTIPVYLLVLVLKAILLYFRDESLKNLEKKKQGPQDPIKVMAERQANVGPPGPAKANVVKKEVEKTFKGRTGANGQDMGMSVKVRPPSVTKEDTKLLKRGERAKTQCIDDAPFDGFFNLYILLVGFYQAELPLELVKARVPLHGLLCIDTAMSGVKRVDSSIYGRLQKKNIQPKFSEITCFWDEFLKILWNTELSVYFKDVVFQVYSPQKLLCEKKKLREFIYKEISYLMYDLSDYKRQHINYLNNMKLWNVDETIKLEPIEKYSFELDDLPNECISIPHILQFIIDIICGEDGRDTLEIRSSSFDSIESDVVSSTVSGLITSESVLPIQGSVTTSPRWSQIICDLGDVNMLNIYIKSKELEVRYNLKAEEEASSFRDLIVPDERNNKTSCCIKKKRMSAENLDYALNYENGIFDSYWKKCGQKQSTNASRLSIAVDYFLYAHLMSKVFCPFQSNSSSSKTFEGNYLRQMTSSRVLSNFKMIENLKEEMQKPHFTVTDCSRSVLRCIPYNMKNPSRDFFCPEQLKLVTPEKVRASSAPEFHTRPCLINEMSFISELVISNDLMDNIEWTVYEDLRTFFESSNTLSNLNGFDVVEELNKEKLLAREIQFWDEFNCIDHNYSVLTDTMFIVLHNKKDRENTYHEVFNNKLKTGIGLRDFFEYVLEDESQWFAAQEELHRKQLSDKAQLSPLNNSSRSYPDSDFWLEGSIKYQEYLKVASSNDVKPGEDNKRKVSEDGNEVNCFRKTESKIGDPSDTPEQLHFEGYNVGDVAVQFSGLKAQYYCDESCLTVEVIERLYGKQHLGVHVRQGGHVLHLYSYVCPEPHILQPFTCHLVYKNGIILAFGKRVVEEMRQVYDADESVVTKGVPSKTQRSSLLNVVCQPETKTVFETREDEEFAYDLKLSLPNGLIIEVIRNLLKPCYIKQYALDQSETNVTGERCRLFLPNGNVVRMSRDGALNVYKVDTSVLTASQHEIVGPTSATSDTSSPQENEYDCEEVRPRVTMGPTFIRYELVTSCGEKIIVDRGEVTPSRAIEVFQNKDIQSNKLFFRREDGTDYVINSSGALCVQFPDGTKISSVPTECTEKITRNENQAGKEDEDISDFELDCVYVYLKVTVEHPDYATVVYDSQTEKWTVLLPFESIITVDNRGNYKVSIDNRTELKMERDLIQMKRFSASKTLLSSLVADLSVFQKEHSQGVYCSMTSSTGETYVVEANSNSYKLPKGGHQELRADTPDVFLNSASDKDNFNFVKATMSNDCGESVEKQEQKMKGHLTRESKYFVVRKDVTGLEVLHKDDVNEALTNITKGSVVHTENLPGPEKLRCFVLISPKPKKVPEEEKWRVDSILPNPKFDPKGKVALTSSTYGNPPSWMHPFPVRKTKFQIPDSFTCRVFIETKRTNLSPAIGFLDCTFCELSESETESNSSCLNVNEYSKKLSEDDQVLLRQLYARTVRKILHEKKSLRPMNAEKLELYMTTVKREVELQDYHKTCIRYHIVPNYFSHPSGLVWLLLKGLIDKLNLKMKRSEKHKRHQLEKHILPEIASDASSTTFSNDEVEFDLSARSFTSFSELSRNSNISSATTPAVFVRADLHPCKIAAKKRTAASVPSLNFTEALQAEESVEKQVTVCAFREEELQNLRTHQRLKSEMKRESSPMNLQHLMSMGLI
ncbi:hypothetical protein RUM43_003779 [Polyplax serrata]|uniref:Sperm-associated antigen 17 n=1 Tax=Polyplax serrata TaxID=468196 RepID=A0AAN8Q1Q4_POLSC